MNLHMVDPEQLNGMYSFWSNLLFKDDKESATETPKSAPAKKPAEAAPEAPATSYKKPERTSMDFRASGAGATMYFAPSPMTLASLAVAFKPLSFATTLLAGLMNCLKDERADGARRKDPHSTINHYGDRVF